MPAVTAGRIDVSIVAILPWRGKVFTIQRHLTNLYRRSAKRTSGSPTTLPRPVSVSPLTTSCIVGRDRTVPPEPAQPLSEDRMRLPVLRLPVSLIEGRLVPIRDGPLDLGVQVDLELLEVLVCLPVSVGIEVFGDLPPVRVEPHGALIGGQVRKSRLIRGKEGIDCHLKHDRDEHVYL